MKWHETRKKAIALTAMDKQNCVCVSDFVTAAVCS